MAKIFLSPGGYWALEMKSGFVKKFGSKKDAEAAYKKEYMSKNTSLFKKRVAAAKRLYKSGRYKTFADAVKAASKSIKKPEAEKRRLGATLLIEKRETRRTKPKRVVRITRTKGGTFKNMETVSGVSQAKRLIKRRLKEQLSRLLLMHTLATNKQNKRNLAKQIREKKAELKKYQ